MEVLIVAAPGLAAGSSSSTFPVDEMNAANDCKPSPQRHNPIPIPSIAITTSSSSFASIASNQSSPVRPPPPPASASKSPFHAAALSPAPSPIKDVPAESSPVCSPAAPVVNDEITAMAIGEGEEETAAKDAEIVQTNAADDVSTLASNTEEEDAVETAELPTAEVGAAAAPVAFADQSAACEAVEMAAASAPAASSSPSLSVPAPAALVETPPTAAAPAEMARTFLVSAGDATMVGLEQETIQNMAEALNISDIHYSTLTADALAARFESDAASLLAPETCVAAVMQFSGAEFDRLCSLGIRIVGAPLLDSMASESKALDSAQYPVQFSNTMGGITIVFAGFESRPEVLAHHTKLAQWMGATISTDVSDISTCDIVVAASAQSQAVQEAMEPESKQAVLTSSWLELCWGKICRSLEDFNVAATYKNDPACRLPPLAGTMICMDQQIWPAGNTRESISQLVTFMGGTFVSDVSSKGITHYITNKTDGQYAAAKAAGAMPVRSRWITCCVTSQKWLSEEPYLVELDPADLPTIQISNDLILNSSISVPEPRRSRSTAGSVSDDTMIMLPPPVGFASPPKAAEGAAVSAPTEATLAVATVPIIITTDETETETHDDTVFMIGDNVCSSESVVDGGGNEGANDDGNAGAGDRETPPPPLFVVTSPETPSEGALMRNAADEDGEANSDADGMAESGADDTGHLDLDAFAAIAAVGESAKRKRGSASNSASSSSLYDKTSKQPKRTGSSTARRAASETAAAVAEEEEIAAIAVAAVAVPEKAKLDKLLNKVGHHWLEMFHNEQRYDTDLQLILCMRETLRGDGADKRRVLDDFELGKIFGCIDDLAYITEVVTSRMARVNETWDPASSKASDVFVGTMSHKGQTKELVTFMCEYYERFTAGHSAAKQELEKTMKRKDVRRCMEDMESAPSCRRQRLKDLLMIPIQHMMRYTMHLKDIQKSISDDHPDKAGLSAVISSLATGMGTVNKKEGQHQANRQTAEQQARAFSKLRAFLADMEGGEHLLKAGRIKLAEVKCKDKGSSHGRKMMLFLMNDSIIVAERKSNLTKTKGTISKTFKRNGSSASKAYKKEYLFHLEHVKVARQSEHDFTLEWDHDAAAAHQGQGDGKSAAVAAREQKELGERTRVLQYQYTTTHLDDLINFCKRHDAERVKLGLAESRAADMTFGSSNGGFMDEDDLEEGLLAEGADDLNESIMESGDRGSAKSSSKKSFMNKMGSKFKRAASNVKMTPGGIKSRLRGSHKYKHGSSFKSNSRSSVKRSASNASEKSRKKMRGGSNKSLAPPLVFEE